MQLGYRSEKEKAIHNGEGRRRSNFWKTNNRSDVGAEEVTGPRRTISGQLMRYVSRLRTYSAVGPNIINSLVYLNAAVKLPHFYLEKDVMQQIY